MGILGVGLVDPAAPLLRADDLGVLRGDGCFETVRVRPDGALDDLDLHLDRLARSEAALDAAGHRPAGLAGAGRRAGRRPGPGRARACCG